MTDSNPTGVELLRIAATTGAVHSVFWSTFIYTLDALQIVQNAQLYRVIVLGSLLWGLFGAAITYRREKDYIQVELLDRVVEHYLGVEEESSRICHGLLDWCYFPYRRVGDW